MLRWVPYHVVAAFCALVVPATCPESAQTEGKFSQVVTNRGVCEVYALYSMTNPMPDRDMPMIVNNEGILAVSFADGGQKSFYTKIKETRNDETWTDETWRRETMMYLGGGQISGSDRRRESSGVPMKDEQLEDLSDP